mgnify:CR=1 FL=1
MLGEFCESFFFTYLTCLVGLDSINHSVIGNAAFDDVVFTPYILLAVSAVDKKVKPLTIVFLKSLIPVFLNGMVKVKDIFVDNSSGILKIAAFDFCPRLGLTPEIGDIESFAEIKLP